MRQNCRMTVADDFSTAGRFIDGPRRDLLLLCDHASNRIPPELGDLGLSPNERLQHIAWDPGAAEIAQALRQHLECPAFFGGWSRLVVDLNRAPDAGDLILCENDGITVHGNLPLADVERQRRIEHYHRPYHLAIQAHLLQIEGEGVLPALVSIHTFTPALAGQHRPWSVGVLWKQLEPWLPDLLGSLRDQGLEVGDNQPYDGRAALGHTLQTHALARGLRHVLFEVRQDLLRDPDDCAVWAARLFKALEQARFIGRSS